MNAQDIRLSVGFPDHPKTIKLERRLGFQGIRSLLSLWTWAAQNRPDGNLGGANDHATTVQRPLDEEDIEIVAKWPGEPGLFVATLVMLGWLDQTTHGYCLHEWQQHNPWVAAATDRGDKARFSRMAKTHPDIYKHLCEQGIHAISAEEFTRLKADGCLHGPRNDRSTDVRESFNARSTVVQPSFNARLTPSPSPSLSPIECKEKEEEEAHTPVCVDTVSTASTVSTALITLDAEVKPVLAVHPSVRTPVCETATILTRETAPNVPTTSEAHTPEACGESNEKPVHSESAKAPRKSARSSTSSTMPAAPDWLPIALWERWQTHRRTLKKPLSVDGATLLFAQLAKAKGFGHDPVELLETAIVNGWQGCVFPDKHYLPARSGQNGTPRNGFRRPLPTVPTDPAAYLQTGGFATELEAA